MPMGNPHLGEMADREDPRVKPEDDVEGKPEDDVEGKPENGVEGKWMTGRANSFRPETGAFGPERSESCRLRPEIRIFRPERTVLDKALAIS